MIHGRPDYNRIQDPAAEPEIYRFLGELADAYETGTGLDHLNVVVDFFGESAADAKVRIAEVRAFAARADSLPAGCSPIGLDEPVFLVRAKDAAAPRAVLAWAEDAFTRGCSDDIREAARGVYRAMVEWAGANGSKTPDLPSESAS